MIIPVLDIKDGIAVSGKSGNRKTYKPLQTVFHPSSHPFKIARSLLDKGAEQLYIADLDAIEGKGSNGDLVSEINQFIPVMLDCGANDIDSVSDALQVADKVIVATETLKNLEDLHEIFCRVNRERIILSIDVMDNKVLSKYMELDFNILRENLEKLKPSHIILLDISRVGTEGGINWGLIDEFTGLENSIILGGGITEDDMHQLDKKGVNKVLVGTALHKGLIKLF
ncbi:HisA/HisF family protein [Methanobacterium formicicum]|uniref:HisA/hisF family protein n=1 Tax=Methanobacterium formicicum (strain DSM 3637 / PP1) TaxID=1204725 RepID=K2R335_METFP|nr:HisA/HisF family protein [Methanobacterium formicicum]EKF85647.1 hisA/hisF family protein [Methanobacterium formicicum DSM 3637]